MTNNFFTETEVLLFVSRYAEYIRRDIKSYIENEGYKYLAVAVFKKEFDIESPNLAEMLKVAFSKSRNLVGSGQYFPARMLIEYAQKDPSFVRKALNNLFVHSNDVGGRVDVFIDTMNEHFKEKGVQSYFDYRFVSFVLAALFPEKYIYVKFREADKFAKQIKYPIKHGATNGERYVVYLEFSEILRDVLARSPEFLEVHKEIVAPYNYKDSKLSWGTVDFIFNCVRRLGDADLKKLVASVAKRESSFFQIKEEYEEEVFTDEYYDQIQQASKDLILEQALAYTPNGDGYKIIEKSRMVRVDNAIQKLRVKKLEDYTCQVCGTVIEYRNAQGQVRRFAHTDHIQDKAMGGNEELHNLWVLCPNCHTLKTYGVIRIDVENKKVYKNDNEISIRDNHLGWNAPLSQK